jgi:hypothetical protein
MQSDKHQQETNHFLSDKWQACALSSAIARGCSDRQQSKLLWVPYFLHRKYVFVKNLWRKLEL